MTIKEDFLEELKCNGKTLADVDAILVAGKEVSWEKFSKSKIAKEDYLWNCTDDKDIVFVGKGNWYIEVCNLFPDPDAREQDSWGEQFVTFYSGDQ